MTDAIPIQRSVSEQELNRRVSMALSDTYRHWTCLSWEDEFGRGVEVFTAVAWALYGITKGFPVHDPLKTLLKSLWMLSGDIENNPKRNEIDPEHDELMDTVEDNYNALQSFCTRPPSE